jgi:MSHA biogenesis protein MshP
MKPRSKLILPKLMRGFSLVAAIFILVVLAALGAFMITIGETERWTAVAAVQGARAYQAAQSGIEWGIYRSLNGVPCAPPPNFAVGDFTVTVTCTPTSYVEGGGPPFNVYVIASTAVSTGAALGSPDYFSRTLQVTVTSAP